MRHLFTLFVACFLPAFFALPVHAQTYRHTTVWTRLAPTYTLNDKWSLLADLYYRRQSHPDHNLNNPFDSPLLYAGRIGASYRTEHWQYILFPAVFFYSYPALGTTSDLKREPVPEWRPSALAEWTLERPDKWSLRLRGGYEYRIFTTPGLADLGRMRFRALWRQGLGPNSYAQLWNETLLSAPPNLPASGHLFDTNRTNLAVGYALSNTSTLEIGYQYTHRQRRSLIEFDAEHALTLTLYLKLNPDD